MGVRDVVVWRARAMRVVERGVMMQVGKRLHAFLFRRRQKMLALLSSHARHRPARRLVRLRKVKRRRLAQYFSCRLCRLARAQ